MKIESILGLLSIALGVLALMQEAIRPFAAVMLSVAVIIYIILSFYKDLDRHERIIKEHEEKLKWQQDLINIKADIKFLKEAIMRGKKGRIDAQTLQLIQVGIIIITVILILYGFGVIKIG